MAPMVYVVVLNWNGWHDTVACVASVLRSDYPRFQVVVCDNGSTDGSHERLAAWARGEGVGWSADPADPLAPLSARPVAGEIPHAVLARDEAESGGGAQCAAARVVFVQTGANLGYAGGCNVGLRYALARGDCAFAWLLNNDAVVDAGALSALVERMRERPEAGQCGSRVLYYDEPARVQGWGGASYNRWAGRARRLGDGAPAGDEPDVDAVERATDFVYGASLLVRRAFLDAVGLMDERYFLYFEEIDWATRGARFPRAYAHRSVVYHREGRSIGSARDSRRRSPLSDYYSLHNRLLFTRRFYPLAIPSVYCGVLGAALTRLRRRQFRRFAMAVRVLCGRGRPPVPAPRVHAGPLDAAARALPQRSAAP
jgi:GT2 family glycosyltransferase